MNSKYQWTSAPQVSSDQELLKVLLASRGVDSNAKLKSYLKPTVDSVYDPFLLHDMQKAIDRINIAIENNERIVIYGDYDADGITSTSLLMDVLSMLGANVSYYVPDRFLDGYGPNKDAYARIIKSGCDLVITVDNGVSGKNVIDWAVDQGIDVVITDHHEIPDELPTKAVAIVHPAYPGSQYPFTGLSGVGVAFKVAWALLGQMPVEELDLVALGEIADVVPVNDENRWLIMTGLKTISIGSRLGLAKLLMLSGLDHRDITSIDVGFDLAPRLNALGRIADASDGVKLLTTHSQVQADKLASETEQLNQLRKDLVSDIYNEAKMQVKGNDNDALIIYGHNWHQGVLGIVASNILTDTGKPVVVVSNYDNDHIAKGSGRSRDGFNLYTALNPHRNLMAGFGGHPQACGLSVDVDQIDELQKAFNVEAQNQGFSSNQKAPLNVDAVVSPDLVNNVNVYNQIQQMQPYGPQNVQPELRINYAFVEDVKYMGDHNQHVRFRVGKLTCVMFNVPENVIIKEGQYLDLVGKLNLNYWHDNVTVQFMVDDVKSSN